MKGIINSGKIIKTVLDKVICLSDGSASICGFYQPVEPESVRRAAEEHRQAKLAKKMAKKK